MAHKTIYLYFATSSQNLMRRGDLGPININLNVKVLGGKVTINKEDKVTKEPQGEATLKIRMKNSLNVTYSLKVEVK